MRAAFLALLLLATAQAATPYRVRAGDTLSTIAARAGVSVSQVRAVNPKLKGDVVKVGATIQIPNRRLTSQKYHVRSGENLTTIARKFGLSTAQLLRANPAYQGGKSVWAGAVITIPGRVVAARVPSSQSTPSAARPVIRSASIRVTGPQDTAPQVSGRWTWPVPGYSYVSSRFGERNLEGEVGQHYGIDIVAPLGTAVVAARSGRVLESRLDNARGWGWTVVVRHPGGWITRYAHLSQTLVRPGELIVQGQRVGRVGNTGHSTGPHLHYGTYLGRSADGHDWNPRNPLGLY